MQQFLDGHDPSLPVIIILQLCKLKKMTAANVELTQVVSQMFVPPVLSVADDLLQTPRMTIEDLIESTQDSYTVISARCPVPRYKVHLQVIDDTRSITFVMFDRVVFQVVGLTAQDLLDYMNNDPSSPPYPRELDLFVNKWMLFKAEVTDANLYRNWRGYNVKKVTSDADVISRFTSLHGIQVRFCQCQFQSLRMWFIS
ncbi:uncharacterized protein LOC123895200 [Trifolium pratense]|uniref:uncharacterized protein LOC123895200 n=1 Tax=Trifolium pratense TaxID=57577 RepID=UPI001E696600|nr:uncharacterized protein LOC123895200 [Trifolium pratense]